VYAAPASETVIDVKCQVLEFLLMARREGRLVVGYGAPAKGNTLLNYCGVGPELIRFTVDRSPRKQGRYLPGVQVPIDAPERILETRPDYVFILPRNPQGRGDPGDGCGAGLGWPVRRADTSAAVALILFIELELPAAPIVAAERRADAHGKFARTLN
jgi:C-methyltransferase C-terminal domain